MTTTIFKRYIQSHQKLRVNGLVCYNNRVVVPPASPIINALLQEYHDSNAGGHSGVLRTFKRLAYQFFWPSMHKTVSEYVAACDTCQRSKYDSLSPAGLVQPLPIPQQVWEDISMDFIDGLPRSDNHTSLLVVVDRLTKYAHLVPLAHPYTARSVASKFIEFIVKLHGIPKSIVSDRDPVFVCSFWHDLWRLSGTKLRMSSAYHPQTDGQTEVINRCIEQFLRCFVHDRPKQWSYMIPWAEFWYNTTFHSSTRMSPFNGATVASHLRSLVMNQAPHQSTNLMSNCFEVGDWVFLKLQPYRQHIIFKRTSHKTTRYFGPFQVAARVGHVAYRLTLPEGTRVQSVFHVSLLKNRVGSDTPTAGSLPPIRWTLASCSRGNPSALFLFRRHNSSS
ncbi:unnamed protein product [Microthlaspi erraticum]|uniref:Integrase catalytic domain-containing protein n=1 Tax=Microthlaspi erraticum TaxID=1685480 RepID=A0A6D2KQM2_9BRAS|nr:unnamed protein product [Microthlaspi erraticum]